MNPMGIQGFKTPEEAETGARSVLFGIPFYVLAKSNDYAWLAPIDYADKLLSEDKTIRIIQKVKE